MRMSVSAAEYRQLADFRYRIREFLQFSVSAARSHGIEPQQHQLLLAIKGLPPDRKPTIRALASRLCLRHNSTVELVNRLAKRGALVRLHGLDDRREVLLQLTPFGEDLLERLSVLHLQQLRTAGPALTDALEQIMATPAAAPNASAETGFADARPSSLPSSAVAASAPAHEA